VIRTMLIANDRAATVLARLGIQACTDVTGFGLAGHLLEMLDASKASARLDAARVPLCDGFTEVVQHGIVSTLHRDNAKVACRVQGPQPAWLFDPQTSGGMLIGVKPETADEAVRSLIEAGYEETAIIGEIIPTEGEPPFIQVNGSVAAGETVRNPSRSAFPIAITPGPEPSP
jgi:selenide,water dikinase